MSEFSTINLVLGIIGTVAGIMALFIHFWRLRKEKPRLEMKVFQCEHSFRVSKSSVKTVSFWTEFQVKNLGDRGTSINDIDLTFEDNGREYRFKKQNVRIEERLVETNKKIWINAHETMDIGADYWGTFEAKDKKQIDCTFIIYHTHGAEEIKTISSQKTEE